MSELKCTQYTTYEDGMANWYPCNCPVCGGFLKWIGDPPEPPTPVCKKCGTELIAIPERDEETGVDLECGKICPISPPKTKDGNL